MREPGYVIIYNIPPFQCMNDMVKGKSTKLQTKVYHLIWAINLDISKASQNSISISKCIFNLFNNLSFIIYQL